MRERFGISILSYNNWKLTMECVDSILETCSDDYKILVVDNCSPDNSYSEIKSIIETKSKYRNVSLISSRKNGGYSYGCNYGFDILYNEYGCQKVILTNNDVVFHENAIRSLIDALDNDNKCVLVVPKVLDEYSKAVNPPTRKPLSIPQILGLKPRNKCKIEWESISGFSQIYSFSGCCLAVNAYEFDQLKRFDENVFLYYEENILAMKAKKAGLKVFVEPKAIITHYQGKATGKMNLFVEKEYIKSCLYYLRRYEERNKITIFFFLLFSKMKVILKLITRRCDNNIGYTLYSKELNNYYRSLYG